jgi:hypothetical protein
MTATRAVSGSALEGYWGSSTCLWCPGVADYASDAA